MSRLPLTAFALLIGLTPVTLFAQDLEAFTERFFIQPDLLEFDLGEEKLHFSMFAIKTSLGAIGHYADRSRFTDTSVAVGSVSGTFLRKNWQARADAFRLAGESGLEGFRGRLSIGRYYQVPFTSTRKSGEEEQLIFDEFTGRVSVFFERDREIGSPSAATGAGVEFDYALASSPRLVGGLSYRWSEARPQDEGFDRHFYSFSVLGTVGKAKERAVPFTAIGFGGETTEGHTRWSTARWAIGAEIRLPKFLQSVLRTQYTFGWRAPSRGRVSDFNHEFAIVLVSTPTVKTFAVEDHRN